MQVPTLPPMLSPAHDGESPLAIRPPPVGGHAQRSAMVAPSQLPRSLPMSQLLNGPSDTADSHRKPVLPSLTTSTSAPSGPLRSPSMMVSATKPYEMGLPPMNAALGTDPRAFIPRPSLTHRAGSLPGISIPLSSAHAGKPLPTRGPITGTSESEGYLVMPRGVPFSATSSEHRPPYNFSGFQRSTPPPDRRASIASLSNSPTTSHSSYGQPNLDHLSPKSRHVALTQQHMLTPDSPFAPPRGSYNAGQYQMMTLETEHGLIQVPVDVQAASKMADEKRKRNAGASARFRQRRKEKEREASKTIAKLEAQIRDASEEKEQYRKERDYFRSIVYSGPIQIAPPPLPSPTQRKVSSASAEKTSPKSVEWQQTGERGNDDKRRRISGIYESVPDTAQFHAHPIPPQDFMPGPKLRNPGSYPTPDPRVGTPCIQNANMGGPQPYYCAQGPVPGHGRHWPPSQ